jgi:enoyl-CoA hydratase/carnithine racemase
MAFVSLDRSEAVTVITIDRPPANALNVELVEELVGVLEEIATAPPSAIVLSGRPGFFSAGADLKAVPNHGPEQRRRMVSGINRIVLASYGLSCPAVAAVTGHAIAGGMVLALGFDVRIASTEGRYGLTEIKVGVPYPQAAIRVVAAELAPHAARRLALGNQLTDSSECLRLGVFDEVVEPSQVVGRAVAIAGELAAMPADVYTRTKLDLRRDALAAMREAAETDPLLA